MERLGSGEKGEMERQRFEADLLTPLPGRAPRSSAPNAGSDSGVNSLAQFMVV